MDGKIIFIVFQHLPWTCECHSFENRDWNGNHDHLKERQHINPNDHRHFDNWEAFSNDLEPFVDYNSDFDTRADPDFHRIRRVPHSDLRKNLRAVLNKRHPDSKGEIRFKRPAIQIKQDDGMLSPSRIVANISVKGNNKGNDDDLLQKLLAKEIAINLVEQWTTMKTTTRSTTTTTTTTEPPPPTPPPTKPQRHPPKVFPAYKCDDWDKDSHTCLSLRAIGDTITFSLTINGQRRIRSSFEVGWTKEYRVRLTDMPKIEKLNSENPPWNIVVGHGGMELRISPIIDTDIEANTFVASVWRVKRFHHAKRRHLVKRINYKIKIMPIDLGYVYIGEEITIDVERYCTLPPESMLFDWVLEREGDTNYLPSNMKVSRSGRSLHIKELRREQEGVIACSMYTNTGVFMTKRRFRVEELSTGMLSDSDHLPEENFMLPEISIRMSRTAELFDNAEDETTEGDTGETQIDEDFDEGTVSPRPLPNRMMYGPNNQAAGDYGNQRLYEQENQGEFGDYAPNNYPYEPKATGHFGGRHHNQNQMLEYENHYPNRPIPAFQNPYNGIEQAPEPWGNIRPQEKLFNIKSEEFYPPEAFQPTTLRSSKNIDALESNLLLFPLNPEEEAIKVDMTESFIVSDCVDDRQCSAHAICVQTFPNIPGHCRCFDGYRGNGIFCWENMNYIPRPEVPTSKRLEKMGPELSNGNGYLAPRKDQTLKQNFAMGVIPPEDQKASSITLHPPQPKIETEKFPEDEFLEDTTTQATTEEIE